MDLHIYDVIDAAPAQHVRSRVGGGERVSGNISRAGGSVTDALAVYVVLRSHKGKVTARVDGVAASAATLVMLAADEIEMAKHSLLMVHNPWTAAMGDAGEMRKVAESLDKHAAERSEEHTSELQSRPHLVCR